MCVVRVVYCVMVYGLCVLCVCVVGSFNVLVCGVVAYCLMSHGLLVVWFAVVCDVL